MPHTGNHQSGTMLVPGTEVVVVPPTELVLSRLRNALKHDGDFPASAKIVSELKQLTSDPGTTASEIAEVILREPSLGTRILHLVNSSFYRRAKPVVTVSQAVVQIGMKALADLCTGLVLLQKFVPVARRGGAFATCLQQSIVTSLLASSVGGSGNQADAKKDEECGYLVGSLSELGTLLLAYYFPQVYEKALKRAEQKGQLVGQSLKELVGLAPIELSLAVIEALDLPAFYRLVLEQSQIAGPSGAPLRSGSGIGTAAKRLFAAKQLSEAVCTAKRGSDLDTIVSSVSAQSGIATIELQQMIGALPEAFAGHCRVIELNLPALPEFLSTYGRSAAIVAESAAKSTGDHKYRHYIEEIREAISNHEPTAAVVTTVMETLAWGLGFDRVLLLLLGPGKRGLQGRMFLGKLPDGIDPKKLERPLLPQADRFAPDAIAVAEGRVVFTGDPLLPDGWPLCALPIGFGDRCIGVIYADKLGNDVGELGAQEQATVALVAELLDRTIAE